MKVYIASPFFNKEEVARVQMMEEFLEKRGYNVYSPMRDGIMLTPDATKEDRLKVFEENVVNVFDCDLMIVIVATKDTGTSVELGMKYAQWKSERINLEDINMNDPDVINEWDKCILEQECPRIITFSDNGAPVNIMLLGAVLKHCDSWDSLRDYLNYVDSVGYIKAKRIEDSISDVKVY